jgi:heterodisulfide reductase subunit B
MDEEIDYSGEVKVLHLLEVLRDEIGWEALSAEGEAPSPGLKAAPITDALCFAPGK